MEARLRNVVVVILVVVIIVVVVVVAVAMAVVVVVAGLMRPLTIGSRSISSVVAIPLQAL